MSLTRSNSSSIFRAVYENIDPFFMPLIHKPRQYHTAKKTERIVDNFAFKKEEDPSNGEFFVPVSR